MSEITPTGSVRKIVLSSVLLLGLQACDLELGGGDDHRPPLNPNVPESIRKIVAEHMGDYHGYDEKESRVTWKNQGPVEGEVHKGEKAGEKSFVPYMRGETDIEVLGRAGVRKFKVLAGDYSWIRERDGHFRFGGYPMDDNGYRVMRNEQAKIKYLGWAYVRGENKTVNKAGLEYDVDFAKREGAGRIGAVPRIALEKASLPAWGESRELKLAKANLDWTDSKAMIRGAVDAGQDVGPDLGYTVVVMGPEAKEIAGTVYLKDRNSGKSTEIFGAFLGEIPLMK